MSGIRVTPAGERLERILASHHAAMKAVGPVAGFVVCIARADAPVSRDIYFDERVAHEVALSQIARDGGDREIWAARVRLGMAVGTARLRRVSCDGLV